jgi:hypothetical protein
MAKLSQSLVLNKYILSLFGTTDLESLSKDLKDSSLEGYDGNNVSFFHHALVAKLYHNDFLTKELLLQYDQNIYAHTRTISDNRHEPINWKYFQYLALLFTELYLDMYFNDKNELLNQLNDFKIKNDGKNKNDFSSVSNFRYNSEDNDLNKIAYWNATGSGKTLLMHINILQFQYYLEKHNLTQKLNRIIVLTPNEGLSRQHLGEFLLSGLDAELFVKNGGSLFVGQKIEIIDIHKLEEESGDKTVAIESFEGNNLVLVDEGHRGSGGDKWKDKRNRLCESGFSFEYSATFGQAVHALAGAKQKILIDEYSKATIFDYSYRYFYNDGYGKDYQILNLNQNWQDNHVNMYLTACILSFYEQLYTFRLNERELSPFLIDKPLSIFVGGKVSKSISKEIASDVVEVLRFFESFIKDEHQSIERIKLLLEGKDGLNNEMGHSIFRNAFVEIRKSGASPEQIFKNMLKEIFNSDVAGAKLHIDNLKGQEGEIGLRVGNADYFGVINVGDDKGLLKICEDNKMLTDERDFSSSLFHEINKKHSSVNVLIGSKKFTEGWSSWRVSTMGLLNIGRGEGSEIIQLFGRGVRLKGYKFSLKRSNSLDYNLKPDYIPKYLQLLETLNIFGLRADYMQQFKDYLEEEGLPTNDTSDVEKITLNILPTIENLSEKKLKIIRVKDGSNFKKDVIVDVLLSHKLNPVVLDWYPKVQMLKSDKARNVSEVNTIENDGKLLTEHLAFLDWTKIYFEIQKFKNERSWYNTNLSVDALKTILSNHDWYILLIPKAELELNDYRKVRIWHELAIALLKLFIERLYNYEKARFYNDKLEVATLDSTHPNFEQEYRFLVQKSEDKLIAKLSELKQNLAKKDFSQSFSIDIDFEAIYSQFHLYQPLVYFEKERYQDIVSIKPVALNKGERDFVEDLKVFYLNNKSLFENKQVYLLRNISKKGIGFFEANNFFPDFILWLVDSNKQQVAFIDPKGLRNIAGLTDPKIELHKTIKSSIQPRLNDDDIELHSFIISNTPFPQLSHWRGQDRIEDFNYHNVYFQKEQKGSYVGEIIRKLSL